MKDGGRKQKIAQYQQSFSVFLDKSSLWLINYESTDLAPMSMSKLVFPMFQQEKHQYYWKEGFKVDIDININIKKIYLWSTTVGTKIRGYSYIVISFEYRGNPFRESGTDM